jgi:hypothetical protein
MLTSAAGEGDALFVPPHAVTIASATAAAHHRLHFMEIAMSLRLVPE